MISMRTFLRLSVVMSFLGVPFPAAAATLIDYFLPTPIYDKLESNAWGAARLALANSTTASRT